jgi:hypothetical protein
MSGDKPANRRNSVTTFACDRCTITVAVTVKATVWCTRCGRRMRPTTTVAEASRTPHDAV